MTPLDRDLGKLTMKYLYLDNFRGFSDTSIPLHDVNFLVGENSTGKTSFLNAIRILSGQSILMGSEQLDDDPPLGHFAEMVSAHSNDKTYFRLGFIGESTNPKKKETSAYGVLLTYENDSGASRIAHFTCTMMDAEVFLRFEGRNIYYRIDSLPPAGNADEMKVRLARWVESHKAGRTSTYKKLEINEEPGSYPLFWVLATAWEKSQSAKETGFSFPPMAPQIVWVAPIRSRPRRTYDEPQTQSSSEGAHIPYVIKKILSSEEQAKSFKGFMKKIGTDTGLFQKIAVKSFGRGESARFEIDAYLDGQALGLHLMGYGISQSLPIFVELFIQPKGTWYGIQQPEVHLHPRAQAAIGDVLFEMASHDRKSFLVETHSDFMIDRFRLNYRLQDGKKQKDKTPASQILFFERNDKCNLVTPITIENSGELASDQPDSYRNFFIKEEMNILGIR